MTELIIQTCEHKRKTFNNPTPLIWCANCHLLLRDCNLMRIY